MSFALSDPTGVVSSIWCVSKSDNVEIWQMDLRPKYYGVFVYEGFNKVVFGPSDRTPKDYAKQYDMFSVSFPEFEDDNCFIMAECGRYTATVVVYRIDHKLIDDTWTYYHD